ncbi:MAG TPA: Crp/Fnr family transcriptional regulator [Chloroflexota bacterium]|nr:Crp/Fnr family transcriptional regulator [Chloroflexota bacterium]
MPAPLDLLRAVPYFKPLPEADLARLSGRSIHQQFLRGRIIMLENEPCPGLYLVESGRVKLFRTSPDGREQVLLLVGPGGVFNDVAVFDGGPNAAAAAAMERTSLYLIPSEHVLAAMRADPEAALAVSREFGGQLRLLAGLVEDLSFRHVTSRVAKLLLEYAEQPGQDGSRARLTQQDLASMVGSVREVVGRSLGALEREGAIRIERARIIVADREALRRMA